VTLPRTVPIALAKETTVSPNSALLSFIAAEG
jgi:hypothetical protein